MPQEPDSQAEERMWPWLLLALLLFAVIALLLASALR